jgi:DNA-binding transcriptional ArsR family regulator
MAARPSTSNRPAGPASGTARSSSRAPVRDFSGTSAYRIEWDVRPVYDFLFSLTSDAGATEDIAAEDRRWLTQARASLPKEIRAEIKTLDESQIAIHVAAYLIDQPDVRTADDFVDALADLPTTTFLRTMLSDFTRDAEQKDLIARAIDGDLEALAALERSMPEHKKGLRALLSDPTATHRRILTVLRAWAPVYAAIEPRIAAIGERDHHLRAAERASLSDADLIETTTGGIRWLPEAGVRRVILAPSYFSRPYNFLLAGDDWRFFGYPVADEALDATDALAPPPAVVRLHRALGDATRMRILKLLAGRDLYMTEIAQQLGLSKPTIKHHLALLRAAGLVTITESGAVVYYTLRRGRLDDASVELKRFLLE